MELVKRKTMRLQHYDYSQCGAYFLTICTDNKKSLFGTVVGSIHESTEICCTLNTFGEIVDSVINELPIRFINIKIDNYVIMPNHVHLILSLCQGGRALRETPLQNKRSEISKVMGYFKMNVSKRIHQISPETKVWQSRFHDHVIRNEKEYLRIWEYVDTNPQKWELDKYHIF